MELIELTNYASNVQIDVAWGEMDAFGHVNNAAYFRYFETARIRYFEEVGWDDWATGVLPILGTVAAKYLAAVVYPDRLTVETGPVSLGERKLVLAHRITNGKTEVVTLGQSVVVALGRDGGKATVPEKAAAEIQKQLPPRSTPDQSGG